MNLNQTILDAAREVCAHKRNVDGYETLKHHFTLNGLTETLSDFETEAALLAMDRLAEFYRWASDEWVYTGLYWEGIRLENKTELELYEIFTTQQ